MKTVRILLCLVVCLMLVSAVWAKTTPPPPTGPKPITMSIREDYDKGMNLATQVNPDFAMMNDLGVSTMVVSFGWDDYETAPGVYDWTWLHSFCTSAASYGIQLRPYICYAPTFNSSTGTWNGHPTDWQGWYNFCYALSSQMASHSNVVSFEIWNEWNDAFWFDESGGTAFTDYVNLLTTGVSAIRAAQPGKQIELGGLVWAHYEAIAACTNGTIETNYEIVNLHDYRETWPRTDALEGTFDSQYSAWFVPCIQNQGQGEPIWFNECGYSTEGRTEADQANWHARAVFYLLADATSLDKVQHYTCYEIKDLDPNTPAIGDTNNYHLGISTYTRVPKVAYYTMKVLHGFFNGKTVTASDSKVVLTVTSGRKGVTYKHFLVDSTGAAYLIVYDKTKSPTYRANITNSPAQTCVKYALDGTQTPWTGGNFTGGTNPIIYNIVCSPGNVVMFKLMP